MSAPLIGRPGSSTFRLSIAAVSMSPTGSRFSSESAPRPFQYGIRGRGGTIFGAALPSYRQWVQADLSASVPKPNSCTAAIGGLFRSLRRRGRATSVARKTRHHRSLAQVASRSRDVTHEERSQDHVKDDRRPQKDAGQTTCETEVGQIQRDGCAVDQHADERRTRPAGDPQGNQSNASHARYRHCDAGKLLTQQQLADQRRNDQQRQSRGGLADGREGQRAFHRFPPFAPCFVAFGLQ